MLTDVVGSLFAVLQGVISVDNPLDQLGTVTVIVTATDNWNGTRDIRRVDTVAVRHTSNAAAPSILYVQAPLIK